ncbi:MAG: 2-amino-4-hydroxy-6-hydroxymethyldihydropteridine diphosphokinase [Lachnospiraceae bacterium]|nr:2-amino-4-hydroxy-6-hydroxymethyldihydropteridine diphosphokinase [Lachnospiraceae bacterium]
MEKTNDKIIIKDLCVFAKHGVFKEEKIMGQKFLVSVELEVNTRKAGVSDNIELSVNYADVCEVIEGFMKEYTFNLIEAAAENLALVLFANFEQLKGVKITIKKPWAPIGMDVDYVAVSIERRWHRAYIALGSNMGDKLLYLENAVGSIKNDVNCKILKISDIILTEPYGPVEQDDFLNGCIMIDTLYTPHELLRFLQKLENDANRKRDVHWGPRTLDLDILLYDDLVLCDDELVIPHPEMHKRAFVLEPLKQIAPDAVHPLLHQRIRDMVQ